MLLCLCLRLALALSPSDCLYSYPSVGRLPFLQTSNALCGIAYNYDTHKSHGSYTKIAILAIVAAVRATRAERRIKLACNAVKLALQREIEGEFHSTFSFVNKVVDER